MATELTNDIKSTFENHNTTPESTEPAANVIIINYQSGFFNTPKTFAHKRTLDEIINLRHAIAQ